MAEQTTLWDSVSPEGLLALPAELGRVDALLGDPAFVEPFDAHFDPIWGRPSMPMETYLRLMFLKYRYRLGYEILCGEVAHSISWRRFARIPLGARMPHPTTLTKITTRCGERAVAELNETLLTKAFEQKVLRTHKVRANTTVVEADVDYPTDSGLLAKAVTKMARIVTWIQQAGGATRAPFRDRRRAAGRRVRAIASKLRLRGDESKDATRRLTGERAELAETSMAEERAVLGNARRRLRRHSVTVGGRLHRTGTAVEEARTRLRRHTPDGATRVVSLHDPDARPVRKGRLGKPVEFGYKAQVVENPDGVILDHTRIPGELSDRSWSL